MLEFNLLHILTVDEMCYVNKCILCSLYFLECVRPNSDVYILLLASVCNSCNFSALTSLKRQTKDFVINLD